MSGEDLHPVNSSRSRQDDELINTILPSYHMFEATISKKLVLSEATSKEDSFKEDPPRYELSPLNSGGITPVGTAIHSPSELSFSGLSFPFPQMPDEVQGQDEEDQTFNQNSAELWERTILANVHKLENLTEQKNKLASNLHVNLHFSDSVCQVGVPPDIIDPADLEYHQGDYIHGYVTIENISHQPIPFDMVYVVFEGVAGTVNSTKGPQDTNRPPHVYKFLNMPDLFASWSYANIDRLVTDRGDPHDWCEGETDPHDNTVLSIDVKRHFQPGITYKRFFSFRIPERLLDDCCDVHDLSQHCQVLPSLGPHIDLCTSKVQTDHSTRKIKDLGFMDSFIGYSVSARIIGRKSQYAKKTDADKYVLAAQASKPIRVVPFNTLPENRITHEVEVAAYYNALVKNIDSKIETGKFVVESIRFSENGPAISGTMSPLHPTSSRGSLSLLQSKLRHLYVPPKRMGPKGLFVKSTEVRSYRHVSSYRKKTLTGFSKAAGMISIASPRTTYRINYVPPEGFRNPLQGYNTTIKVPFELTFSYNIKDGRPRPPEPKGFLCEIVALTILSRKHEIPTEITHEMCVPEETVDEMGVKKPDEIESFETMVVKPFDERYQSLISLMKEIGFNNPVFLVETQLFKDVKSMAMLLTRRFNLLLSGVKITSKQDSRVVSGDKISDIPWEYSKSAKNPDYEMCSKTMDLHIDLSQCHLKGSTEPSSGKSGFDKVCLVPEFQSCFMCRLYFVRISVRHKNGILQVIHVPLSVTK